MRPTILRYDSLPSTNTEAANQAQRGAEEGLCIVALEQTAGRGRQQRSWASSKGAGLYFSIVLRPHIELTEWPLITLMTSLAVADALFETCGLRTDIKWPNDILTNDRKICGILTETAETNQGRAAVVGIGVNLKSHALPPGLRDFATSVEDMTGTVPDFDDLMRSIFNSFSRRYDELHQPTGPIKMLEEWESRSSYSKGRAVRISLDDEIVQGITRGLASDGALRIETESGDIKLIHAGDVAAANGQPTGGRPYND